MQINLKSIKIQSGVGVGVWNDVCVGVGVSNDVTEGVGVILSQDK